MSRRGKMKENHCSAFIWFGFAYAWQRIEKNGKSQWNIIKKKNIWKKKL